MLLGWKVRNEEVNHVDLNFINDHLELRELCKFLSEEQSDLIVFFDFKSNFLKAH